MGIGFQPPPAAFQYPGGSKSACCISVDFDVTQPDRRQANHSGTQALVDLGERCEIVMTWALCGKAVEEDPAAYRAIVGSSMEHEIAVHTYSHVDVSTCSAEELTDEVDKCIRVLGLDRMPKTFVFPWNREGHFATLQRLGFLAYRGAKRMIAAPAKSHGLWNVPPVYYIDQKSYGAEALIRRLIDVCISYRSVFHLWLHPWSVVQDEDAHGLVHRTLEPVFRYLAARRAEGDLTVSTLGKLAEACEGAPGAMPGHLMNPATNVPLSSASD